MSERPESISFSARESSHTPKPRKRLSRGGFGVTGLLLATAMGGVLPTAGAAPTMGNDKITKLKHALTHAYLPGSVKLVEAQNTGIIPMRSNHAPDREIVTAHIDYRIGNTPRLLTINGDPLPPREKVVGPNNKTRPGVVEWADYPSGNYVNMEVQLTPFLGNKVHTRKYQLYLTALSRAGNHGKPLAAEYYAGTVDISGKKGVINSVSIENDPAIPRVHLIYPNDASSLSGPSNANPTNG